MEIIRRLSAWKTFRLLCLTSLMVVIHHQLWEAQWYHGILGLPPHATESPVTRLMAALLVVILVLGSWLQADYIIRGKRR